MTRLAGRAAQLADLLGAVDDAVAGAGELVCVVGPSGVGKTALVAAAISAARARGVEVLAASAPAGHPDVPCGCSC